MSSSSDALEMVLPTRKKATVRELTSSPSPLTSPQTKPVRNNGRRGTMPDFIYYTTPPNNILHAEAYENAPTEFHIDGFQPNEADLPIAPANPFRCFPPPRNAAYELDSHCRIPRLHPHIYPEFLDPWGKKNEPPESDDECERTLGNNTSMEEDSIIMSARSLQGLGLKLDAVSGGLSGSQVEVTDASAAFDSDTPPGSSEHSISHITVQDLAVDNLVYFSKQEAQIEDSPRLDEDDDAYVPNEAPGPFCTSNGYGSGQPEYCQLCKKSHIPSGFSEDAHYADLPVWFPRTVSKHPWKAFQEVMNRLLQVEDCIEKGYPTTIPSMQDWNLQFHAKGPQWTTKHARDWGGWWKCRSTDDAPDAERNCAKCNRQTAEEAEPTKYDRKHPPPLSIQRQYLQEYIDHHFKAQGERDKQAALAKIRIRGVPDIYSKPMTEEERKPLMEPKAKHLTSATGHHKGKGLLEFEMGKLAILKASEAEANVDADIDADGDVESEGSPTHAPRRRGSSRSRYSRSH